jgi:hypothetical protein
MAERGAQPGNNNATKNKPFLAALQRAIAQDDGKKLRAAAEKLMQLAADGEAWAVKELADRTDGKALQGVTLAGPDDGPIKVEAVARQIIDGQNP